MPSNAHPSVNTLIGKIAQFSKTKIKEIATLSLFTQFVKLFYSRASIDDIKKLPVETLFGMAYSVWQLVRHAVSKPDRRAVRVFNPEMERDGWQSSHTVVVFTIQDMPFIVDSARIAMNELGMNIHFMIYTGGVNVKRNAAGVITEVVPYDLNSIAAHDTIEAPIYIEIDRQTDPDVLRTIETQINSAMHDVEVTVQDWKAMRARVQESIEALSHLLVKIAPDEVRESIAFLNWLLDDQFTLLGVRDYKVVGSQDQLALELVEGSGLGVLRDEAHSKQHRLFSEIPESARAMMLSTEHLLVISKTNTMSTVHRHVYTDYIGIKKFNDAGELIGERRIIGLYTSLAYSSHPKYIPFLRHKVASVLKKSGLPLRSHAGKDLMHILETFPRDDLFQASSDELFDIAMGVMNLQDRKKTSLFVRQDVYNRYVSCLVYVPRDYFSAQFVACAQHILMETFHGTNASYTTYFYTPTLTRIHYIIRIPSNKRRAKFNLEALEAKLVEAGKTWQDHFCEVTMARFDDAHAKATIAQFANAFPAGYRETFTPDQALKDIELIETMDSVNALGMTLYRAENATSEIKFKLFRYQETVPLSDALPILEHMGLRVVEEQAYECKFKDGTVLWINDFTMTSHKDLTPILDSIHAVFEQVFLKVWSGEMENDVLNGLVFDASLSWREISMLRAYIKYLKQAGFTYSTPYIAETFLKYPLISKKMVALFYAYFDPEAKSFDQRETIETELLKLIDDVALLDEDKIFRRFLTLIKATLRTNYFISDTQSVFSFKFSPDKIPELPLPLPKYEVFVYSPVFEGIHLRAAKVARGGLRWSERREDFRTEVLGLMKAQQVKNAVIVPSGAKGGFVLKNAGPEIGREKYLETGIACYKKFIGGLLDITDNMQGLTPVPPKNVVCYDDIDTYLVVAADKGTATFSDIANQVAVDRGFWLGDAFASGGCTGYDHKKMGITARGAWVSAKRHFQGLNINVDAAEITVVGIGDLAGDVFGNGVLMSPHIKLVAAFNHQHIFLDPNPNPEKSFQERKRIFELPRSQWSDYASNLISTGGGVHSRQAKFISLTNEVKKILDVAADRMTPNELISAILKAPVDLIWNGGIGTFVKAASEKNEEVGDRANDALRVNGAELRARVVAEGGNLGFTQLGRVEYAMKGGLINTDFIDNSAGVDCSDHEVNIKILLNAVVEAQKLSMRERNKLLSSMTDAVSELVLSHNYHQSEAVSYFATQSSKHMSLYIRYLEAQEEAQKINRVLEYLPDSKALNERRAMNQGLTRPETAVLLSYSKIILKEAIRNSDLLDAPNLQYFVDQAFPAVLSKKFEKYIGAHRLRHEILATQLANFLVNNGGITFAYQMEDETAAPVAMIVRAFVAAYQIFGIDDMYAQIEALDYKTDMMLQYQMIDEVMRLLRRATRWMLRNYSDRLQKENTISDTKALVKKLYHRLPNLLSGRDKEGMEKRKAQLHESAVPESLACLIASARSLYHGLNIIEVATRFKMDVYEVAQIYFILFDKLDLHWFRDRINDHPVSHRWSVLAKAAFKADMDWVQRELTASIVRYDRKEKNLESRVDAWLLHYDDRVVRWRKFLTDFKSADLSDFSIVSVGVRELFDLTQAMQK